MNIHILLSDISLVPLAASYSECANWTSCHMSVKVAIVVAIAILNSAVGLPLPDFFDFGPNFDQSLPAGNDESVTVSLIEPLPFYGQQREFITVSY